MISLISVSKIYTIILVDLFVFIENIFYNTVLNSEIELEYERINTSYFEDNADLMLTIEDISNLSIILSEK